MYRVVETCSNFEPWWPLEDWQGDIVHEFVFPSLEEAVACYNRWFSEFSKIFSHEKTSTAYLTAFWAEEDLVWCNACDDYLQTYHGIAILAQ